MIWREITGYRFLYRVSDMGTLQRQKPNGTWHDVTATNDGKKMTVHMETVDGRRLTCVLARIVYQAFYGSIPDGHKVVKKNGLKADCSIYNLVAIPLNANLSSPGHRKTVLKLDRNGEVVAIYKSALEAAAKNHISKAAICKRCRGEIQDPYRLDGYNYVYEERDKRRKRNHG